MPDILVTLIQLYKNYKPYRLFDWRPEKMRGERGKHERTVIIKNLFTPELFDKEVHLIIDYQNDLREECSKCGTVRKVIVYDVSFKTLNL